MDLYKVHAFGFVNENKNKKVLKLTTTAGKSFKNPMKIC
jgi:hypothetical protein